MAGSQVANARDRSRNALWRVASLGIVALLTLTGLASITATVSAGAETCAEFEFIGARGSGEAPHDTTGTATDYDAAHNYGVGDRISDIYRQLAGKIGATRVTAYGVHYPAQGIAGGSDYVDGAGAFLHIGVLGAYKDSTRTGTNDTIAELNRQHTACPTTKFFLAGYSQGAQAVGDAIQKLSSTQLSWIVGAAFLGDPYFNATSWSSQASESAHYGLLGVRSEWPEALHGKIFSYCHTHDPICHGSKKQHILGDGDLYYRDFFWFQNSEHSNYVEAGDTGAAATQLAGLVGTKPIVTGTVPLDLVFVIDSTGSMGGIIDSVKSNVSSLAATIASTSSNYRFALVDFKDIGDPYQSRVDTDFTTSLSTFTSAVSTISAGGGGDTPESMYSGIMSALNLGWRNGVRKNVIVISDAPGKDPEPGTGFTLSQVRAKALAVDPAQVYALIVAGDPSAASFMQSVADETGGKTLTTDGSTDVVDQLNNLIVQAGSAPTADAGGPYTGFTGDPVDFTAGGSRPGSDFISSYAWDWNNDGAFDDTTLDPVISHTFPVPGHYDVTMRAIDSSGLAGTASASVDVTDPPAGPPPAPSALGAVGGDTTVKLTWTGTTTPTAQYFVIRNGSGAVLDAVVNGPNGEAPPGWVDQGLTNGTAYSYAVAGGNARGEGAAAGPVSATPHGAVLGLHSRLHALVGSLMALGSSNSRVRSAVDDLKDADRSSRWQTDDLLVIKRGPSVYEQLADAEHNLRKATHVDVASAQRELANIADGIAVAQLVTAANHLPPRNLVKALLEIAAGRREDTRRDYEDAVPEFEQAWKAARI